MYYPCAAKLPDTYTHIHIYESVANSDPQIDRIGSVHWYFTIARAKKGHSESQEVSGTN